VRRRPVTGQHDGGDGSGVPTGAAVAVGTHTAGENGVGTGTSVPGALPPGAPGHEDAEDGHRAAAQAAGSRFAPRNWRVRWRLLALIVVPTIAAVILGGLRISSAASSAVSFKRVQQLAVLNSDVIRLAQNMEDERDLTAGFIASGRKIGALRSQVLAQQSVTDQAAQQVTGDANNIGSGYSTSIRQDLSSVLARIADLPQLRSTAMNGQLPTPVVIEDYTNSVGTLLTFTSISATGSNDPQLTNDVIVLTALARAEDQASEQRGTLYGALVAGAFAPGGVSTLESEGAQQTADLDDFNSSASLAEQQSYQNTVSGTQVDQAAFEEKLATTSGASNGHLTIGTPAGTSASQQWYNNMTFTVGKMRTVEQSLVSSIVSRAQSLQSSAFRSAVITSIITLVLLLLVLLLTTFVAAGGRPRDRGLAAAGDGAPAQ
jgi:hypothetical protein